MKQKNKVRKKERKERSQNWRKKEIAKEKENEKN